MIVTGATLKLLWTLNTLSCRLIMQMEADASRDDSDHLPARTTGHIVVWAHLISQSGMVSINVDLALLDAASMRVLNHAVYFLLIF